MASSSCSQSSQYLLTNGYMNMADTYDMHNMLVAATMANDAYPFARQFGFNMIDVVQGLRPDQVKMHFHTSCAALHSAFLH